LYGDGLTVAHRGLILDKDQTMPGLGIFRSPFQYRGKTCWKIVPFLRRTEKEDPSDADTAKP
jgi:hypothetical protein